jgi:peptidoglycan/LPS O-acetylase OafA/YrhL
MSAGSVSEKRFDIQALRAVAVLLVVVSHVWPGRLSGGYVGVDVFFVISGFLITAHLLREVEASGGVSLLRFWARRIRRLLPAAFAVLLFCLVAAVVVLPATAWPQTLREIVASAVYVENWSLALDSVDYMAAENDATMLQHFWSLSVEEQFYIVWPLLILGVLAVGAVLLRRRGGLTMRRRRVVVAVALGAVAVASLATSVVWTELSPASAYFSTATRAWEFALGGLLSFVPAATALGLSRGRMALHLVACWGGLALIAYAAFRFDGATAFPGVAAVVPVLGAALVIWAGDSTHQWSPAFAGRFGPVQFVGDISYSVYLWHWPFVVLYPLIRGRELGIGGGLLVIAMSLVVGALSKRFIEDPFRRSGFWSRRVRRSFGFAVAGVAVTAALVGAAGVGMNAQIASASEHRQPWASTTELQQEVTRTLSLDRFPITDQPAGPQAQVDEWYLDGCVKVATSTGETCVYGDPAAEKTLILVGDSYATHLLPAIRGAFEDEFRIEPLTLGQCSITRATTRTVAEAKPNSRCVAHNERTLTILRERRPDMLLISDATEPTLTRILGAQDVQHKGELYIAGIRQAYAEFAELGVPTVVLETAPKSNCYARNNFSSPTACEPTAATRRALDLQAQKETAARDAGLGYVGLSRWMCTADGVCPDQIGHMLVRADRGHLTDRFSASLSVIIEDSVERETR